MRSDGTQTGLNAIFIMTPYRTKLKKKPSKTQVTAVFRWGFARSKPEERTVTHCDNPTSGFLLFVPKSDIIELKMSVEDCAKLVISAGLVYPNSKDPTQPADER